MPAFSRKTILAATDLLENRIHSDLNRFELEYGLENEPLPRGSIRDRATGIARYLLANPHATDEDGRNLTDVIVEVLVRGAM